MINHTPPTPAPWRHLHNGHFYEVRVCETAAGDDIGDHSPSIGSVFNNNYHQHTSQRWEANARLMACAPEMLELLKSAIRSGQMACNPEAKKLVARCYGSDSLEEWMLSPAMEIEQQYQSDRESESEQC